MLLPTFSLPLQPYNAPEGFGWEGREFSILSTTAAFDTGIDQRDKFKGLNRRVACGHEDQLQRCYIIPVSKPIVWSNLKRRNYLALRDRALTAFNWRVSLPNKSDPGPRL